MTVFQMLVRWFQCKPRIMQPSQQETMIPVMDAGFSQMWQALPDAVFDPGTRMLHTATGFAPLIYRDTIYVRDCYVELTEMALGMTPVTNSKGGRLTHPTDNRVVVVKMAPPGEAVVQCWWGNL